MDAINSSGWHFLIRNSYMAILITNVNYVCIYVRPFIHHNATHGGARTHINTATITINIRGRLLAHGTWTQIIHGTHPLACEYENGVRSDPPVCDFAGCRNVVQNRVECVCVWIEFGQGWVQFIKRFNRTPFIHL